MPEILIVDDIADNLKVLKLLMEEQSFGVRIAMNGPAAIESVSVKVPDLILMDIKMPGMSGLEATKKIKAMKEARDVPIIFVTALTDTEHILSAFSSGGVDYITKPYHRDEVIARVNTHIHLKQAQDQLIKQDVMTHLTYLVTGMAHELNTPLGICITATTHLRSIIENTEQVLSGPQVSRATVLQCLQECNETNSLLLSSLERASAQVEKFKAIAIDQCYQKVRKFNLKSYVEDWRSFVTPQISELDIGIKLQIENIELESYPGIISTLLTELLQNSILHAYTDHKPALIEISTSKKDNMFHLNYCDGGKGMPQEQLKKVFTPFFTTRRGDGHIGLSAVTIYNLVTSGLGGDVKVSSPPGKGLCYEITFSCQS